MKPSLRRNYLPAKERLIVALDNMSHGQAIEIVKELNNVSHFKLGIPLLFGGRLIELIDEIQIERGGRASIFVDLKFSGDIEKTIETFIREAIDHRVKFLTLSESPAPSVNVHTIAKGKDVRSSLESEYPLFLMVPLLSSLEGPTLSEHGMTADYYIVQRATEMIKYGCDGLIVSGEAIKKCRDLFSDITIVSPAIRPVGTSSHDHKRFTTPAQAIQYGSDYLVVGRPIIEAKDKQDAAQEIINEIDEAANLERQKDIYAKEKKILESAHAGKWVVVHDGKVHDPFPTFEEAAAFAVESFGRGPYLIREIGSSGEMFLPASVIYQPVPA